eukprot:gene19568-6762_t
MDMEEGQEEGNTDMDLQSSFSACFMPWETNQQSQ